MQPPLPVDEKSRLKALQNYEILDTPPEQEFDDITLLASQICGTPIAMVSLIDADRQWFKSKIGTATSQTPRDIAFCAHGILQAEVFVVNDAQADQRFSSNPLVTGDARIRFYAGAPLITSEGHALGMLCVNDQVPRELTPQQLTALRALSRQVVALLEARRVGQQLRHTVSQLKRAQLDLEWHAAVLEAQVNSSIDGIVVVDKHRTVILQNQRLIDLLKMPPEIADERADENRHRWLAGIVNDPEAFQEKTRHLYSHPEETSHDEIVLKDGTALDCYSSPATGKDGTCYGRIWTFRDITARKRMEGELFRSQKLKTVGKLAGGIAHEFNSILTAIIGQSELLMGDLPRNSPLAKNAREINQAAGRAATLTRQLLAYGRRQILQPETLDLNRLIVGLESVFRLLMGIDVDTRIVPAAGLQTIKADAGQIEQVIMNIIINARDAMPQGGKLTLETANVSFDEESVDRYPELKAGDYVMLAISDTGAGIPDEIKPRLFEPFFTTKSVGQGTGLGLSTCYGIVKQSGGHISVYSEAGRGATFKIYLPQIQEQPRLPVPRAPAPELPRGAETILLVEDDPALREMVGTLLKRLGYTVWSAANGVEALSLKQQCNVGHIDLLFTDVVMPHMSGKELAERVARLYPHTKILFTTAYTESAIVHQGVLEEGVALLKKPFTPSALARKVREVLEQVN